MKRNFDTGMRHGNEEILESKPWEDRNGKPLEENKLRFVSKYWSEKTWERFLSTLEKEQVEYIPARYEKLLHQHDLELSLIRFFELNTGVGSETHGEIISKDRVLKALKILTSRERQTIHAIFYEGLSQSEAARMMQLSVARIHFLLHRALKKLKDELGNSRP